MSFYVYMLRSQRNGTLYIGMTDDLVRRVWEHRIGARSWVHQEVRSRNARLVRVNTRAGELAFMRERQLKKCEPRLEA